MIANHCQNINRGTWRPSCSLPSHSRQKWPYYVNEGTKLSFVRKWGDKTGFDGQNWVSRTNYDFVDKIKWGVGTKLSFCAARLRVPQKWVLCDKIKQGSILWHKINFVEQNWDLVWRKIILCTNYSFVRFNVTKVSFCTKLTHVPHGASYILYNG